MSVTEIGKRLKLARQQAHITQAEVAKRLGVSFQTISSYERGINRVDSDTLMRLCEIYNVPIGELMANARPSASIEGEKYSDDERELIELYRRADKADRLAVNLILQKYADPEVTIPASAG